MLIGYNVCKPHVDWMPEMVILVLLEVKKLKWVERIQNEWCDLIAFIELRVVWNLSLCYATVLHSIDIDVLFVLPAEGDLTWYSQLTDEYRADHGYDCYLFSPLTRPQCVQELYKTCALTPVATLRQCNLFRTDGKTGSKLFSRAPVVLDDSFEMLDLEMEIRMVS